MDPQSMQGETYFFLYKNIYEQKNYLVPTHILEDEQNKSKILENTC